MYNIGLPVLFNASVKAGYPAGTPIRMILNSPVSYGLYGTPAVLNVPVVPPQVTVLSYSAVRDVCLVTEISGPATAV